MQTYVIRRGDSLSKIAQKLNTSIDEILKINPQIENPNKIYVGHSINIPEEFEHYEKPVPGSKMPWFEIAKKEMEEGVDEIAGPRDNPRIIEYHQATTLRATNDETAWCSSFVNWCMKTAGVKGTRSAAARSWESWGEKLDKPERGCVVVLKRGNSSWQGHVGFYYEDDGSRILVLGGNQSNQVNISSYPKSKVLGFRMPGNGDFEKIA